LTCITLEAKSNLAESLVLHGCSKTNRLLHQWRILLWLRLLTEAAALAIVDLLAHLDHQVATEVTEDMVNLVHLVNEVIQLHPTNLTATTSPNNVHAKLLPVIKDQLEPKAQMDQLVTLVLLVQMANLVNKVQKVHLARMAKQANQVKKVQVVNLVTLLQKLELLVLLEVQVKLVPLVLLANLVVLAKMVNLVDQALQVTLAQLVLTANQAPLALMETKANKAILAAALTAHQPVWLQVIKSFKKLYYSFLCWCYCNAK